VSAFRPVKAGHAGKNETGGFFELAKLTAKLTSKQSFIEEW